MIVWKKKWQFLFRFLHKVALWGMNYHSNAGSIEKSGELAALDFIKRSVKSENEIIVFDVGANIGKYSKKVLTKFSNLPVRIYAFEPTRNAFFALQSMAINQAKIIPLKIGLSSSCRSAIIYYDRKGMIGSSLYKPNALSERHIAEDIELVTLDEFCNNNQVSYIHLLKIDVEGHELDVILGARELINNKKIKFIQFEMSFANINSRVFFKDLYTALSDRYNIYRILQDGLYPINKYERRLEIFEVANFLAVLK